MNMQQQMFTGVKVLAVARVVAAPFAAYHMALHGADVITVENPDKGDMYRYSDHGSEFVKQGIGLSFLSFNSNKRSLTLRIDLPEGQEIFRKLAKGADVVIENLRGGTMDRYGLGYEHLRKINPGLVFCSVTGYGQTGAKKNDPAIDDAIQAASGLMSITGTPESGPLKTGSPVVDYVTGYAAAFAIAGALFQRGRTGEGQAIDIAMLETAMTIMSGEVTRAASANQMPPLVGNGSGKLRYVSNSFRCKEGVIMIAARADHIRERLWRTIDRLDIPQDPRFLTTDDCRRNLKALNAEVEKTLQSKTAKEWEALLNKAGVPAMEIRGLVDALNQPNIKERGFLHWFEEDRVNGLPAFAVPTASYRLSASPAKVHSRPPRLGQHTDEVLSDLGLPKDEIARLRQAGIV